jgi:predicted nuclease with TOPRIM domain
MTREKDRDGFHLPEPIAAGELVRCEECGARLWNERPPTEPVVAELVGADGISALVERLRGLPPHIDCLAHCQVIREAADTITRLEAEKAKLQTEWAAFFKQLAEAQATIARLEAEIERRDDEFGELCAERDRLREALESIVDHVGNQEAAAIRAALTGEKPSSSDA